MSSPSLIAPTELVVAHTRLRKNIVVVLGKIATRCECRCGVEVYVLQPRSGRPLIVDDELNMHRCGSEGNR